MAIETIDPNFRLESIDGHELAFLDASLAPFHLTGLPFFAEEGEFSRLPKAEIPAMNSGVQAGSVPGQTRMVWTPKVAASAMAAWMVAWVRDLPHSTTSSTSLTT